MGMVFSVNFGDWNGNDLVGMPGWEGLEILKTIPCTSLLHANHSC